MVDSSPTQRTDVQQRLPVRIDAEPLVIRRWTTADADAMTAMITASLDHLRPWMAWAQHEPLSHEQRVSQFRRWDRYWASGAGAVYGVFAGANAIGGAALHRRVGPGGLDIGYWLGAEATGHGHATRVAGGLTRAACAVGGVTFTEISHSSDNRASAAVAQRLDYHRVDALHDAQVPVTTWRHHCGGSDH